MKRLFTKLHSPTPYRKVRGGVLFLCYNIPMSDTELETIQEELDSKENIIEPRKNMADEVSLLRQSLDKSTKLLSWGSMFLGGMFRGAGIVAGATLFVILAGWVLKLMGFLPGLSDVAEYILDAFNKASLN
jgi:hypothetical protein